MEELSNAVLVFVIICAAGTIGFVLNPRLPQRHRSAESLELIRLMVMLLVTFTSIVLGLLTTSVKSGFDVAYNARAADASAIARLDNCLGDVSRETDPIRAKLRSYVGAVIASTWPDEAPPAGIAYPDVRKMPRTGESPELADLLDGVGRDIRALSPANPAASLAAADCRQRFEEVMNARWKVIEGLRPSISPPFLWVLVFWLTITFAAFGLTARPNALVMTVMALSALSVSVAVFVILDLDHPYGGLFGISSESMRAALADMLRSAS